METHLTLVRHGETLANVERVWHGSTDTPLNDRGQAQAVEVGRHLAVQRADALRIYASPLQRTRDTAAAIVDAMALPLHLEPDLREYDLGAWEGRPYAELVQQHRLFERMQEEPDWQPGGGESARAVAERLAGALERIAAAHPGERTIVVSHGGALTLALGLILDGDPSAWRRVVDNCSVSDLAFGTTGIELTSFNETGHLQALDPVGRVVR